MALQVDEYLATGDVPGAAPRPPHRPVRVLRQLRRRATASGSRSRPSSRASGRTCAPRSGSSSGSPHQTDDAVQDEIRADLRAAFLTRDRDEWAGALCAADTCVAPVLTVPEVVEDAQFAARGAFVDAKHPEHGTFRQVGPMFAGMTPPAGPVRGARRGDHRHRRRCCRPPGSRPPSAATLRDAGVVA